MSDVPILEEGVIEAIRVVGGRGDDLGRGNSVGWWGWDSHRGRVRGGGTFLIWVACHGDPRGSERRIGEKSGLLNSVRSSI